MGTNLPQDTGTAILASGHVAEIEPVYYGSEGPWGPAGWYGEVSFIFDPDAERVLWVAPDWEVELDAHEVDPEPEPVEPPAADLWFLDQQYTEAA